MHRDRTVCEVPRAVFDRVRKRGLARHTQSRAGRDEQRLRRKQLLQHPGGQKRKVVLVGRQELGRVFVQLTHVVHYVPRGNQFGLRQKVPTTFAGKGQTNSA